MKLHALSTFSIVAGNGKLGLVSPIRYSKRSVRLTCGSSIFRAYGVPNVYMACLSCSMVTNSVMVQTPSLAGLWVRVVLRRFQR